jgi:hypothetical protein
MAERKYEKYILTDLKVPANVQAIETEYNKGATRILWLEDEIMEGASSVILSWYWKPTEKEGSPSHIHDYDEVIGFIGSDPQDPHDLGGEIEFWLEDEKYDTTRSCFILVPRGMKHCPMIIKSVDRPLLHLGSSVRTDFKF